jgi:hypothetical protein
VIPCVTSFLCLHGTYTKVVFNFVVNIIKIKRKNQRGYKPTRIATISGDPDEEEA